ncbi:hypothetical protein EAI_07476 [Harpegnathos saltator]|uniref:Uncharacterized protein n=1 Tax=Harpegnathos saltator TaxID=610380 RepID=E2B5E2_HARSA|nr:hypothetical protein EAI_07476 [Harpegnathos saltator]
MRAWLRLRLRKWLYDCFKTPQKLALFPPLNTRCSNFIITANTLIKLTPQLAIRECTIYIDRPAFLWLRPNNTSMDTQAIPPGSGRCSQQLENPIQLPRLSTPGVPAVVDYECNYTSPGEEEEGWHIFTTYTGSRKMNAMLGDKKTAKNSPM